MHRAGGIREIEHCRIEMPDGIRLSAKIWMPPESAPGPYPALLEYIPYRKRDMTRVRDERNHPVFASRGYVCLRVDMRGSGDSEGLMADMYADEELADARNVIDWIASQSWCNGRVGMFGTSWGGTASLQAAVDAPEALKAVLANCATIDRFEDDIHYMGGCLLTDSIEWGATLPAILAAPPDSATVGSDWCAMWRKRLDNLSFPLERWLRESRFGSYWRQGSVRFQSDRLRCPILAIGGWSDRYSNSVVPLVRSRPDLCWGVVGPWGHHYPDQGHPGPAIGFQALALAWWDHWLKQDRPGDLDWPKLRLWRREFDPPSDSTDLRAGAWIEMGAGENPEPAVSYRLSGGSLSAVAAPGESVLAVPFRLAHGVAAGDTGYFGRFGGLPLDQRQDDELSLAFDSGPLEAAVTTVGAPELQIGVSRARGGGQLVLRLCDVAADGTSSLVCRTIVNLAQHDRTLDGATPADGGQRRYRIHFPNTAYRFAAGHRIRLCLAASYWPLVWPDPADAGIEINSENARLCLPAPPADATPLRAEFPQAEQLQQSSFEVTSSEPLTRSASSSLGKCSSGWRQPLNSVRFDGTGTTFGWETSAQYEVTDGEPLTASCVYAHRLVFDRADGCAKVDSKVSVSATDEAFVLQGQLTAVWEQETVAAKTWRVRVPRLPQTFPAS